MDNENQETEAPESDSQPETTPEDAALQILEDTWGESSDEPEAEAEPTETPAAEAKPAEQQTEAEASRADKLREAARKRREEFQESQGQRFTQPPPQPAQQSDPLYQATAEQIRQAMEFQQLFRQNPVEAARRAGLDPTRVYEDFTQEALNPGRSDANKSIEELKAELKATRAAQEQAAQQWQQWQQQQQAAQQYEQLKGELRSHYDNSDAFPVSNRVPWEDVLQEAIRQETDFRREYGYQPTMHDVMVLVEDRFDRLARLAGGETTKDGASRGASNGTAKGARATTTRSSAQPITNDLASQQASPAEVEYTPEAAAERAERELEKFFRSHG